MQKNWWKEAVVYQIYPKSFMDSNGDGIGDIPGIISKLDYLADLGISVIWISPLYKSPNKDNGYDISDYQAIQEAFGTMEDFELLLAEAHKRGLKIIMDLVVNHSSDQHRWFVESRKSKDNPYRDYYIWRDPKDGKEPTNWGAWFGGGPAWEFDEATGQYYLHQFVAEQPDLNWANPVLRKEIYDMMNWWCQKGIDGFRMDVINVISKPDVYEDGPVNTADGYSAVEAITSRGPHVHEYLKEMHHEVLSKYDLLTVGETPSVTIEDAKKFAGFDENEINMVFQFEHMYVDCDERGKWTFKRMHLPELKAVMSKWQTELAGCAWNSLYWNNHDQPRIVSRWGNDGEEFRAISAKMLATCLHMLQGTPYIYQGEELGMTNFSFTDLSQTDDIEIRTNYRLYVQETKVYTHEEMMTLISRRSRDNGRTPMQWNTEENAGFSSGNPWLAVNPNYLTINAESQINDPNSIRAYYKRLIQLRKENEVIVYGSYDLLCPEDEKIFTYIRTLNNDRLLVVCNFSDEELIFPDELQQLRQQAKGILIGNYSHPGETLRPYEAIVYQLSK